MKRVISLLVAAFIGIFGLTACSSDADVASQNLSKDADQFKIVRSITFVNGITDKYLLTIVGYCSLGNDDKEYTTVTCKLEDGTFVKHFMLRSDNVTVVVEQLTGAKVSTAKYKVIWKPTTVIPDVESGS